MIIDDCKDQNRIIWNYTLQKYDNECAKLIMKWK
jgi:hypothetical protein